MMHASRRSPNRLRLALISLEDRSTPASAVYAAGTLTITAATGDAILVALNSNNVPGFLEVTAPAAVFDSLTTMPVSNLIVKAGLATNYTLGFGPGVALYNLTVTGASTSTGVTLDATTRVLNKFTFTGGNGDDTVSLTNGAKVGGHVALTLGNGVNQAQLRGGVVGGNVTISAGNGNDTVNLINNGPLTIGGSFKTNLGDGDNDFVTIGNTVVTVGRDFDYSGSGGSNNVDFAGSTADLIVGGNAALNFGATSVADLDYWLTSNLIVGGNFTVVGGSGGGLYEVIWIGPTQIGGNYKLTFGNTANKVGLDYLSGMTTTIGGHMIYTSGSGTDELTLDNVTIGRNATLNLGGGATQFAKLGTTSATPVEIAGNLTIKGGANDDLVDVVRTRVGGTTTISTFDGIDTVRIDDADFGDKVSIDLGAGGDTLAIETRVADFAGALVLRTRFGSSLTVLGGDGADSVTLGVGGTGVDFGGPVKLVGGAGADTLSLFAGNTYLSTRVEDFELGDNF
jgi:hypothetical protein